MNNDNLIDQLMESRSEQHEEDTDSWEEENLNFFVPSEQSRPRVASENINITNPFIAPIKIPISIISNEPCNIQLFCSNNYTPQKNDNHQKELTTKQKLIIALLKELGYPIDPHF